MLADHECLFVLCKQTDDQHRIKATISVCLDKYGVC